ncbi:MAG TPA: polyribonucleotide nucleotidyltransferase [Vitreimonas sp.]|uniref:polyribonucleotide nucleotidyltransferase n=1 Tax=Vitreimonas sp. TaxID=3069702 RepID=UPI002D3C750E|nr:polyribonucleotide nucleotidyltransferase [Vitreimonas sp.]HYD87371.1 polyribonucleotide nucleotidyltransferase [Vitreimonas sp.]
MFDVKSVSLDWAGRKLTLETGKVARQADGAVFATWGETALLATVVYAKEAKPGQDFFPLTVNYQEKYFASGRIPGGYFKREGRPTERETLLSRLIDRPIRPLFVDGFKNEVQVIITVLSWDNENESDILAMVAASAALTISGVPFMGPIGASRIGWIDGKPMLNPTIEQMKTSDLDLVVAGTANAIMMVESEVKELTEAQMLEALTLAHKGMQPVIDAIIELAEKAGKEPFDFTPPDNSALKGRIVELVGAELADAYKVVKKDARHEAVGIARDKAKGVLVKSDTNPDGADANVFKEVFKEVESDIVRSRVVREKGRIDGRPVDKVRPIEAMVGFLPRTHGSALFTRGETQAIVVATLGTAEDEQFIDALSGTSKERFLLHYNFPPYSVGETGRMGGAGRREIGHGKLAWRAMKAVLPTAEQFPYTVRLVSEITESNGSSSMATVCGSSLALMDAGVPIAAPVAGVAMGLILEDYGFEVLTDILGDEDHLGDMDFKVAGTEKGITSLQMDIKVAGITQEIMQVALDRAHAGRMHILGEMNKALNAPRESVGATAPRIVQINIPVDKIRDVIGTGGKVIREIVEKTGAKINVEDDGTVKVASANADSIEAAVKWIKSLTSEPEVGQIYEGKVVKVMEFGAFVNFFGAKDGLVHVSQLARERVEKPGDVVKEGDTVKVKLLGFDDRGKVRLSMKVVDQATGADLSAEMGEEAEDHGPRRERSDRGDRGPRRGGGGRDRGDRPRRESSGD